MTDLKLTVGKHSWYGNTDKPFDAVVAFMQSDLDDYQNAYDDKHLHDRETDESYEIVFNEFMLDDLIDFTACWFGFNAGDITEINAHTDENGNVNAVLIIER